MLDVIFAMKFLRDEMHSMKKASESDVVQTSDSLPKAGPSKQPDLITTRTSISMTQASIQSDAQPMGTDHYGPPLTPKPTQSIQSEHASRHLDLESDHSDHHSESEQPKRVCSKAKKHSDKMKHKVRAKYYSHSSSSEEDQSSVPIKKSTKPQQKAPPEPEHQDSTDPVFYMETDVSDLPSGYAEEVETFRQILDLPDLRETLCRSSTTMLGLDSKKSQQELRPRGPFAMVPLDPILKDAFEKLEQDFLASNLPEGKYIKPPASTAKYYKVGQPCFEDKLLLKSVFPLNPLGPLRARFPYKFLRNLNIKLGRFYLPSILQLLSLGLPLPVTLLWRSVSTVSRVPSKGSRAKFKRVPIPKELSDVVMIMPVIILKS